MATCQNLEEGHSIERIFKVKVMRGMGPNNLTWLQDQIWLLFHLKHIEFGIVVPGISSCKRMLDDSIFRHYLAAVVTYSFM